MVWVEWERMVWVGWERMTWVRMGPGPVGGCDGCGWGGG